MYIWQHQDWPIFKYDEGVVEQETLEYRLALDRMYSLIRNLPADERNVVMLDNLVEEGIRTSSIEGERISRSDMRSSIINNNRFGPGGIPVKDKRAKNLGAMLAIAFRDLSSPLTETTILYWHELLFSSLPYPGVPGQYRTSPDPMRIISGPTYQATIHFEAPPAKAVPKMMRAFFENIHRIESAVLRAGLAHLYFESIHPFSDGNGRIGRTITEYILARREKSLLPFSVSYAFEQERQAYYDALRASQTNHQLDATPWLSYYFSALHRSLEAGSIQLEFTLRKIQFFQQFDHKTNDRQRKVLARMWEAGPEGFSGGMTTKKYLRITRTSPATAQRDLAELTKMGALRKAGLGRGTKYQLSTSEES